jgi:NAD(P)H dehydrogenase (quinone)
VGGRLRLGHPHPVWPTGSQLKQFIDQTGPLWIQGHLANKVATSFTSSSNAHGGQESTILALNNVFYHWGWLIVAPGYTHPVLYAAGGNPYGTSYLSGLENDSAVSCEALAAAHYQGHRLARYAEQLVSAPADADERRDDGGRRVDASAPYDLPSCYPVRPL